MTYILTIPTTSILAGRNVDLWWVHTDRATGTLLRENGVWSFVTSPPDSRMDSAEYVYRGGYYNEIPSPDLVDELVAAGYGDWIATVTEFSSDFSYDFN